MKSIACVRFAGHLSKLQNRKVALPGFVGSPAHCWSHWFLFPPLPTGFEGHAIPDVRQVSLELLAERFAPVFNLCKQYGVTFDLECHPSERAMGDLESAHDYLAAMDKAGYAGVCGFNLDGSHLEWQNVSVIDFIREFKERIHCAHVKGVWVAREHCRGGRLGGHLVQGHVDGTGTVLERLPGEQWEIVKIALPPQLSRYVVEKGSITVDGVSLTVVDAADDHFTVSLIPTTLGLTTLGIKQPGDPVNLEVDVLAKYVERLLGADTAARRH